MVIVYRSNTGFTKEYAEMLAKAEKMKVFPLAEAQGKVGPGESEIGRASCRERVSNWV